MKQITAILLIAIAIAGCNNTARQSSLQESNDSLKTALLQKDADMQALIATITTIEEGFKKINAMQGRITVGGPGSEISYSETLESDIAYITETLAKNKAEIERLKQELASKKSDPQWAINEKANSASRVNSPQPEGWMPTGEIQGQYRDTFGPGGWHGGSGHGGHGGHGGPPPGGSTS